MAAAKFRVLIAGLFAGAMMVPAQETPAGSSKKLSLAEQEDFLRTGKVIKEKGIGEGVTNSTRLTLDKDGFVHDAHLQTINEAKTRFESNRGTEMNFKDTYKFNIAAYELAKMLGIENMIPPSIERKHAGKTGAFTWWIDGVMMEETQRLKKKIDPPNLDKWNLEMYVVRVFDQLIANTDRNLGNLLIDKEWKMWMIDHTRAFRMRTDLPSPKNLADPTGTGKCDRQLLVRLRELNKQTLKQNLGKYLTGMEIDGLVARRDKIVKFFDGEIKAKGEGAVLFDRPARD